MNEIQIFNHEKFGELRTIEIDGQIYFVGVDVARALEYKNPRSAVSKRVRENHKKTVPVNRFQNGNGSPTPTTVIDESGFYSLVLASKCKGAEPFQEWVTSEVLPTIRKTGSYNPNPSQIETTQPTQQIEVHIDHVENLHITQKKEVFLMQEKNNSTPAQKKSSKRQKIGERTHIYRNADGSIFGKKVVNKFSDGSKNAIWFLFNPETNCFNSTAGLSGATAPLYNFNILHNNKDNTEHPIVIVEGEKDVETLANMEILATSLPNGGQSKQWHELYNDGLQGHDIIILTDNDKTGETYGETVAKNVSRIARSVKIVPAKAIWSECPEKGDISDIAETLGQDKTIELLLDAIKKTEYYVDISDFEELINDAEVFPKQKIKYSIIQLSKVEPETQEFLWNPYIPIGELTIMYAAGGTGKSFATVGIASDITTGRTLPIYGNQQVITKPEKVLFISAEDNESVILNRMREARGNPDNCFVLKTPKTRKELDAESFLLPQNKDDIVRIQALADLLEEIHPKLVIIDPWSVYIGDDKNMNKANDVRGVTNVLTVLAKEFHCAILVVAHVNKMPQTENANNAVSGSTALIDSSRSALCIRSFGADSDRRVMIQTKSNYQKKAKSVCYRIINQGENRTACFEWDGFTDLTEDDLTKSARTGKSLSDIADEKQDEGDNIQAIVEVITALSEHNKKIPISFNRFKTEIIDFYGEDFLGNRPKKYIDKALSDLRNRGIGIDFPTGTVRGLAKDGTREERSRGFYICCLTDGSLMADALPK
ncbi:MAG: AAA family ATPase [Oscillospiraceae bacterium]|nr:AAA family ATPase [Oscillospiraceae bacterium]